MMRVYWMLIAFILVGFTESSYCICSYNLFISTLLQDHVELIEYANSPMYSLTMVIDGMKCSDVGNYSCQVLTTTGETSTNTNIAIEGNAYLEHRIFRTRDHFTS